MDTHSIKFKTNGRSNHYYHFFFGVFIPMVDYAMMQERGTTFEVAPIKLGSMRRHLERIPERIKFGVPNADANRLRNLDRFNSQFYRNKNILSRRLVEKINVYMKTTNPHSFKSPPKRILIERGKDPSIGKDENGSGSTRRSMGNHKELKAKLELEGFVNVVLEDLDIYQQWELFNSADSVVAQHGAGLANILFMRPRSTVVEVVPKVKRATRTFDNLSRELGLRKRSVIQEGSHSEVDVEKVLRKLKI